jgi:L-glutamine:2-deoxy-scyllo-inosose/3-amino-2,3-dideoxy-scyllo-inosose aminotransferase
MINIYKMNKLAMLGGSPVRNTKTEPWPKWPVWDSNEEKALIKTLNSGVWSYNGPMETEFNKRFAEYTGVPSILHGLNCLSVTGSILRNRPVFTIKC